MARRRGRPQITPGANCSYQPIAHGPTQDPNPAPGSPAIDQGRHFVKNPRGPRQPVEFMAPIALRREVVAAWPALAAEAQRRGYRLPPLGIPRAENMRLLGESLKVKKGLKKGVATAVLYLAPSDESLAVDLCPSATPECRAACLGHASGQMAMISGLNARAWKTILFMLARPLMERMILAEATVLARAARKKRLIPAVRFDGSSDTGWGSRLAFQMPDVVFYDYTKRFDHMQRFLSGRYPRNVHLTFSFSGDNTEECLEVLRQGGNVAVVFDAQPGITGRRCPEPLPAFWHRFPVIDADDTDIRFQDPPGHVAGLRFKQAADWEGAKEDAGRFVVRRSSRQKMLPVAKKNPGHPLHPQPCPCELCRGRQNPGLQPTTCIVCDKKLMYDPSTMDADEAICSRKCSAAAELLTVPPETRGRKELAALARMTPRQLIRFTRNREAEIGRLQTRGPRPNPWIADASGIPSPVPAWLELATADGVPYWRHQASEAMDDDMLVQTPEEIGMALEDMLHLQVSARAHGGDPDMPDPQPGDVATLVVGPVRQTGTVVVERPGAVRIAWHS